MERILSSNLQRKNIEMAELLPDWSSNWQEAQQVNLYCQVECKKERKNVHVDKIKPVWQFE